MARLGALLAFALCVAAAARVGADTTAGGAVVAARTQAASRVYERVYVQYQSGTSDLETVYRWSVRWLESQRDAKGHLPSSAAHDHLARMGTLAALVKARVSAGVAPAFETEAVEFFRLEADLWATQAAGK